MTKKQYELMRTNIYAYDIEKALRLVNIDLTHKQILEQLKEQLKNKKEIK
jgi:hypothetical protein